MPLPSTSILPTNTWLALTRGNINSEVSLCLSSGEEVGNNHPPSDEYAERTAPCKKIEGASRLFELHKDG
jgi:hypothetical protein